MSFFIYVSIYAQGRADTIDRFPYGLVCADGCPFKDERTQNAMWLGKPVLFTDDYEDK